MTIFFWSLIFSHLSSRIIYIDHQRRGSHIAVAR